MLMNDTMQSILRRQSHRSFTGEPLPDDALETILEAGRRAPSAMNRQPWHFTVITNRAMLDQISAENKRVMLQSPVEALRLRAEDPDFDSFRGAPMAIIVSGEDEAGYAGADCANAVENMALAAQSLGLSSCYLASFKIAMETPALREAMTRTSDARRRSGTSVRGPRKNTRSVIPRDRATRSSSLLRGPTTTRRSRHRAG